MNSLTRVPGLGIPLIGRVPPSAAVADARAVCITTLRPLAERAVLRVIARGDAAALDGDDSVALRAASAAARERGLGAEHLVVALKAVWRERADAERVPHEESNLGLARLVTRGIETFYTPPDALRTPSCGSPRLGGDI